MKNQIRVFFTALMFYTRIPCPSWVGHSDEMLNKATRYLPLIGWIVGLSTAVVLWASSLIFPTSIAVILSFIVSVLITGAFHEDGFADVCDGFGGGWTKERIFEIMKDSRIGAYGVVGLILLFALKFFSTMEVLKLDLIFGLKAVVLAHVLSRFNAVKVIYTHEYSRADATSKVKPLAKKLATKDLLIAFAWIIPALLTFDNPWVILVLIPLALTKWYLAAYFKKWIDGYTGDCLGAVQQVSEVVVLLFCLGLWKFI